MDWTPYIVIWLLCGLVAGLIAQSKGGDVSQGVVLGVLLGPIGILIALVSGRPKIERVRTYASPDEYTADFHAAQAYGWKVEREKHRGSVIEVTYRKA